jgi:hypothetical protein
LQKQKNVFFSYFVKVRWPAFLTSAGKAVILTKVLLLTKSYEVRIYSSVDEISSADNTCTNTTRKCQKASIVEAEAMHCRCSMAGLRVSPMQLKTCSPSACFTTSQLRRARARAPRCYAGIRALVASCPSFPDGSSGPEREQSPRPARPTRAS